MRKVILLFLLSFCYLFLSPSYPAQENSGVEMKVKRVMMDPYSKTPVVLLEATHDKQLMPIWIDVPEARSIALGLEHVDTPRPLTHDLIRNILQGLGATLQRITITDLKNNTYFATLTLKLKGQDFQIDSRPSDAIAVALRMKAPIYASSKVLAKAKLLPSPEKSGDSLRTTLGIHVQDLTSDLASLLDLQVKRGALVADVEPASPASEAGIKRGDIIVKVNEKAVQKAEDLETYLQGVRSPAQLKIEVIRQGKPTLIVVSLPS